MKTPNIIFVLLLTGGFGFSVSAQQQKPTVQTVRVEKATKSLKPTAPKKTTVSVRPVRQTGTTTRVKKTENMCKPMDIRRTTDILRDRVGRSLQIQLDKDYGFIEIMGNKQNLNFGEYKINKAGHDWVYYLTDVKSQVTRVDYRNNTFIMTITFEDDGSEIKGECPGCRIGKDNRAPDINWQSPSLQILMQPLAYNNSFTFQVTQVNMGGKFDFNGMLDKFLPPVALYFQRKMEATFKDHMQRIFNSDGVRHMLTDTFKPEIQRLGLTQVKKVDMSHEQIYLCNY